MPEDVIFQDGVMYQKATTPSTSYPGYNSSTGVMDTTAGQGGDVLVPKLADEVIPFIRQQSYMRQFFRTIDMPTLQFNVPKISQGANVYFVNEGSPVPFTTVTTETIILTAKKLMTSLTLSSELTEDNIVPILPYLKKDIAKAFALAEEEVFLYGKEAPGTAISGSTHWGDIRYDSGAMTYGARAKTITDDANATESNWFANDKRLAFDGLSVLGEAGFVGTYDAANIAATAIDASSRPLSIDDVNQCIQNLGVFGRDKGQLILMVSLREEKTLRADPTILTTLEKFGPSTVFLTGEIGRVYGIPTIATNLIPLTMGTTYTAVTLPGPDTVKTAATKSEAFVVNRNAILLGDRRLFTLKASDIPFILADQLLLVATERIAMAGQYRKAICKVINIDE